MRVSTADFIKNYGTLADRALMEPVTITKNGRDRLVVISAEEFERLKQRDRRVVSIEAFTEADIDQLATTEPSVGLDHLDAELKDWQP
jgi:hypothetical protein